MRIKPVLFLGTIISMATGTCWSQTQTDFSFPAPPNGIDAKIKLWATHYFVHEAATFSSGAPFRDSKGKVLSDPVSHRNWCLAAIEGTVRVKLQDDAHTLNFGGVGSKQQVNCAAVLKINPMKKPWITATGKSYFVPAVGPFGDGVAGYKLVPYRTIAVDKSLIPYGTVIFIPSARGEQVITPSGAILKHDGYFFAADTGGALKGNHIDTFCGLSSTNCLPSFIKNNPASTFEAYIVKEASIVGALRAAHK